MEKKFRPIPAGKISFKNSLILSFICITSSLFIALLINKLLLLLIITYLILQISYSFYLKRKPLADLFCISSGFLLRAIAGGVSSGIFISHWFLITVGLLSLFLAVEKRKKELHDFEENGNETRGPDLHVFTNEVIIYVQKRISYMYLYI